MTSRPGPQGEAWAAQTEEEIRDGNAGEAQLVPQNAFQQLAGSIAPLAPPGELQSVGASQS
ncbi:hypothetical protein Sliba_00570 [Streptomyces nigrescens]|uniref:Uncharacterized protein n=1 Tax=Streptomyces nigrescens TaxID=1920 RepID=A0A640T8T9_STRNI|nr:hypothetical protein Sliba_00570 [Streptomyces libani subsp. libani]GGW04550.1 hypothetical protein GCM10010500_66850 [Streptomyces libani subsp. libani]